MQYQGKKMECLMYLGDIQWISSAGAKSTQESEKYNFGMIRRDDI